MADVNTKRRLDRSIVEPSFNGYGDFTRKVLDRFRLRASLLFGSDNPELAVDDVEFGYRVASRERALYVPTLLRFVYEAVLGRTLINGLLSASRLPDDTGTRTRGLTRDNISERLTDMVNYWRVQRLDQVMRIHRSGTFNETFPISFDKLPGHSKWLYKRRIWSCIDWNAVLRDVNAHANTAVEVAQGFVWQGDHDKRHDHATDRNVYKAQLRLNEFSVGSEAPSTADFICVYQDNCLTEHILRAATAGRMRQRVVLLATGLADWKLRHGEFPSRLRDLAAGPILTPSDAAFIDPFTHTEFNYAKSGDGFEIRSPGPDGKYSKSDASDELSHNPCDVGKTCDYVWEWHAKTRMDSDTQ